MLTTILDGLGAACIAVAAYLAFGAAAALAVVGAALLAVSWAASRRGGE